MSREALQISARQVMATRARSFRWASAFLPERGRDAAALLYAFCRLVDDTADDTPDKAEAAEQLELLREELWGRRPPRPLVAACREILDGPGLGAADQLIEGARSDLGEVCMSDDDALLRYCYRVAGTVGLMMCPVLGVTDPRARAHAVDLGVAMQITNICRDVAEDAAMGRVYLPAARLHAAGSSPELLLAGAADPQPLSMVVRSMLALADVYYRSGDAGMRYIPWRSRVAILVASRVYRAIGVRLLRQGANPLQGRVVVPWFSKLRYSLSGIFAAFTLAARPETRHQTELHYALQGLPGLSA